jgi:predicted DNA-binding WGR domain protein
MQIDYRYIGWCREDNHDKVWAAIMLQCDEECRRYGYGQAKWVTVWGRRGKKLQHKVFENDISALDRVVESKHRKGYTGVNRSELDRVYPEFQEDLEKTTVWALLTA